MINSLRLAAAAAVAVASCPHTPPHVQALIGGTSPPRAVRERKRRAHRARPPRRADRDDGAETASAAADADATRRRAIAAAAAALAPSLAIPIGYALDPAPSGAAAGSAASAGSASSAPLGERITFPLEWNGQAYLLYYRVGGDLFRAALDTGSPFLMVPGTCDPTTKFKWGCYRGEGVPSGLSRTYEMFDGVEGEVEWRSGPFAFVNATGSMMGPPSMIFGVASPRLMGGSGGVFFGLVRDTDNRIRPSFLGQTMVEAFNVDLASDDKTLTLSTAPMVRGDYVQMVNDLRRRYGDPTLHYTARARAVRANGAPLAADGRPIYAIFDTGVTGMVVSREIFDERYSLARERREKRLWRDVEVSFRTARGRTVTLSAESPLVTPFSKTPWKRFNAHLVVLGLSFLEGNSLTIDISSDRLQIEGRSG